MNKCKECSREIEYDKVLEKYECPHCGYRHTNNLIQGGSLCVTCEIGFVDARGGCNWCDTSIGECPQCHNNPATLWRLSGLCTNCDPPVKKDRWIKYQEELGDKVDLAIYHSSDGESIKTDIGWKNSFRD